MGVRLSYCVNDEVVKLVLARLSDRDPLSSRTSISGKTCGESNRSENGSATVLWCNSRGASVEGQEGWRGSRDEAEGFRFRVSVRSDQWILISNALTRRGVYYSTPGKSDSCFDKAQHERNGPPSAQPGVAVVFFTNLLKYVSRFGPEIRNPTPETLMSTNRLDTQFLRKAHELSYGLHAELLHNASAVGFDGALGRV